MTLPMPTYTTLSEAVNDRQRRGHTDELLLGANCSVAMRSLATTL